MRSAQSSGGTWRAVLNKAAALLAVGHTRLELLSNELEVARASAMRQLILAQAMLFCVALGVMLTVIGLSMLFWEQRLLVVALAGALVWGLAAYFFIAVRRSSRQPEPVFGTSLAELQEDLRQLRAAASNE
jgi:uncharacterized membrane protein YqjE